MKEFGNIMGEISIWYILARPLRDMISLWIKIKKLLPL
jgi:hypothetical protein